MGISQINTDFNENTEPKDEQLMTLLKQAYQGEIMCQAALAKLTAVQPFSDYKPTISEDYRAYFMKCIGENVPPALYVYAKDGKLIMSDDYVAMALYKELRLPEAICIVIGDTPAIEGVTYYGEPFKMPLPTVEVLPEADPKS